MWLCGPVKWNPRMLVTIKLLVYFDLPNTEIKGTVRNSALLDEELAFKALFILVTYYDVRNYIIFYC